MIMMSLEVTMTTAAQLTMSLMSLKAMGATHQCQVQIVSVIIICNA